MFRSYRSLSATQAAKDDLSQLPNKTTSENTSNKKDVRDDNQGKSLSVVGKTEAQRRSFDRRATGENTSGGSFALDDPRKKSAFSSLSSSASRGSFQFGKYVTLKNYMDTGWIMLDSLHHKAQPDNVPCTNYACKGSLMFPARCNPHEQTDILREAEDFIDQYYASIKRNKSQAHIHRWEEVQQAIETGGIYEMTTSELTFGAKTAWRNAPRCIGRMQWSKLQVFDGRDVRTAEEMFDMLVCHLKFSTNKGILRSAITVFPARTDGKHDYRIWNNLLIGYAGYRQADGSVIGDPNSIEITEACQKLGWTGKGGRFDILPLVLQADGQIPIYFEVPPEAALEVPITHPRFPWFEELGLRWFAVPAVSNMMFDCGGLQYTGCAFSGWYMSSEIGTRDLCDPTRYNMLQVVAKKMNLDMNSNRTLWKDQALVEMNIAVLHSYQSANVTIIDHHSAAEIFMRHLDNEQRLRGGCPTDWVWVVPPISSSLTPIFHQETLCYVLKPSYEYQPSAWSSFEWPDKVVKEGTKTEKKLKFKDVARGVQFGACLMKNVMSKRVKCTILYATETGKSKHFAFELRTMFNYAFNATAYCMDEYDFYDLSNQNLVFFVVSTFGNGDPPENGEVFSGNMHKAVDEMTCLSDTGELVNSIPSVARRSFVFESLSVSALEQENVNEPKLMNGVNYSVFGLGSRAYPKFCAFGHFIDDTMSALGASRICGMKEGDELCGQVDSFKEWQDEVFKTSCEFFCVGDGDCLKRLIGECEEEKWASHKYRLKSTKEDALPIIKGLTQLHKREVFSATLISRQNLQPDECERQTILVKIKTGDDPNLIYSPGDHLAVFPTNRPSLVLDLLSKLEGNPSPNKVVHLEHQTEKKSLFGLVKSWNPFPDLPMALTIHSAFSHYFNITSPPTQKLLKYFTSLATDIEEKNTLETLLRDKNAYDDWRHIVSPNIVEFLEMFPSVEPPATLLLAQLPLLQHRFYSISSSLDACPGEIHLTVAVVKYNKIGIESSDDDDCFRSGKGPVHYGVCSTYLNTIPPGDEVPCFIRAHKMFHLPEDLSTPTILIGPGTGLAPFRGFWQQREIDLKLRKASSCNMTLYYGCRTSTRDYIHERDMAEAKSTGALSEVHVALSREVNMPKTYVQDLLLRDADKVYGIIMKRDGHLYICGDVSMAHGVTTTLENIIADKGSMSSKDAQKILAGIRDDHRLHEDIFGVTLHTSEVTSKKRGLAKILKLSKSSEN